MIIPALDLARGWLSVAHASSKDKDRPALNRTLSLEQHPGGLRITATDSYMILTTFVPAVDHDATDEPGPDEAPLDAAVAIDADGRGAGLFTFLTKLAAQYDERGDQMPHVSVRLNVRNRSGDIGGSTLPGLAQLAVVLEVADLERVELPVFEGEFPRWQGIVERALLRGEPTMRLALHPDRVAALAKVAKVQGGTIGWTFGGELAPARVEILESEPFVHGAVMPVRWDLWRDVPAETPAEDGDGEEG